MRIKIRNRIKSKIRRREKWALLLNHVERAGLGASQEV
jgi:hypothetical protein